MKDRDWLIPFFLLLMLLTFSNYLRVEQVCELRKRCDILEAALALQHVHIPPPPWERHIRVPTAGELSPAKFKRNFVRAEKPEDVLLDEVRKQAGDLDQTECF